MANQQDKDQSALNAAGNLKDAAKLAKDVGRVFAGDMTAIKDILLNKLFWEILLVFGLIISLVGMVIGGSITGVIENIAAMWSENWDENWEEAAIDSNGNELRLKTVGWIGTFFMTDSDTKVDIGEAALDFIKNLFTKNAQDNINSGSGTSDNTQIGNGAGTKVETNEYQTTVEAIGNQIQLTKALQDRLDMIKGRVKQRGEQIAAAAKEQYIQNQYSTYNQIAERLTLDLEKRMETGDGKILLYAGYNEELSEENFNFDLSAFELTDLQALKILAMFAIQNDCQLTEVDMWSLMDYLGWYNPLGKYEDLDDTSDSIYEVAVWEQHMGSDIGSAALAGYPITSVEFEPLKVPVWTGTCAPQWCYEEMAAIREHNQKYETLKESGRLPEDMISWDIKAPSGGNTFGIIDKLYYSAENHLTVMRSDYSSADQWTREEIQAACNEELLAYWDKYVWAQSKATTMGTVSRDADGKHSYTFGFSYYNSSRTTTDEKTGIKTIVSTSYRIDLRKYNGWFNYSTVSSGYATEGSVFTGLEGSTQYTVVLREITTTTRYDKDGKYIDSQSGYRDKSTLDSFTTYADSLETEAYQLYTKVDISFEARSIDELCFDLLGVWPGNLTKTVQTVRETAAGNLIGCTKDNQYSFCLQNARIDMGQLLGVPEFLIKTELFRSQSYSEMSDEVPLKTTKTTVEYGINTTEQDLQAPEKAKVIGSWRQVSADGRHLIWNIAGNQKYYIYARMTMEVTTVNKDGSTDYETAQVLLLIDTISPQADTKVENGTVYAAGHLGNENMKLSWNEIYTAPDGKQYTLTFTRDSGYQYESYVDSVMALAELLEIPYENWEPAMLRAQQLKRTPAA